TREISTDAAGGTGDESERAQVRCHGCGSELIRPAGRASVSLYRQRTAMARRLRCRGPRATRATSRTCPYSHQLHPLRLARPFLPTMMWSCTDIPSGTTIALVIWISACDGGRIAGGMIVHQTTS